MKRFIASLLLIGLLAGCNTIQGVGRDIKAAGGAIENASKK
ncbi:entericidin A/B family lipoprotein [Azohydromonas aeria]|nr:entericidin A/B family lipoprotein [Azohydromonas aeria]